MNTDTYFPNYPELKAGRRNIFLHTFRAAWDRIHARLYTIPYYTVN